MGLQLSKIPQSHIEHIKSNIFDVLADQPADQPAAQRQIVDIIVNIAKHDTPQNWPLFAQKIKANTLDSNRRNLYLQIASDLFQRYRFELASDKLFREIKFIDAELSSHITSVFKTAIQELSTSPRSDLFVTLNHCVNIFCSLNAQDLTEHLENELIQWFIGFGKILSFDQQAVEGDHQAEKNLHFLWKTVVRAHTMFANQYEVEFKPYIKPFMDYLLLIDKCKLKKVIDFSENYFYH